jgi:hypothetical protein
MPLTVPNTSGTGPASHPQAAEMAAAVMVCGCAGAVGCCVAGRGAGVGVGLAAGVCAGRAGVGLGCAVVPGRVCADAAQASAKRRRAA